MNSTVLAAADSDERPGEHAPADVKLALEVARRGLEGLSVDVIKGFNRQDTISRLRTTGYEVLCANIDGAVSNERHELIISFKEPLKSQMRIINDVRQKNAGHLIPFWHWFAPALDDLPQAYLNMINLSTRLWEMALRNGWAPPEFESQITTKGGTSRLIAQCREFSEDLRRWKRRGSPPGALHHPALALMQSDMREREREQRSASADTPQSDDQVEAHEEAACSAESSGVLVVRGAIDMPHEAVTEPNHPGFVAELVTDASTVADCATAGAIPEPANITADVQHQPIATVMLPPEHHPAHDVEVFPRCRLLTTGLLEIWEIT